MYVFLCNTPLHALIAKRIIETENVQHYVLVYLCFDSGAKHKEYFSMLAEKSDHAFFCKLEGTVFSDIWRLSKLSLRLRNLIGTKILLGCGNIKHFHSRYLMLVLGVKHYFTFDDGSGNISGDGYFYDLTERKDVGIFFKILAPRLLYKSLVKNILVHYSIYDFPNVFTPCKHLNLIEGKCERSGNDRREIIYLANAFSEDGLMDESSELQLDRDVIDRLGVTQVLLHPRSTKMEHFVHLGVKVIQTNMIAEDYILHIVPNRPVTLVGVYSTALLNLSSVQGVKLVNVCVKVNKPVKRIIKLMKEAGVAMEVIK